MPLQRIQRQLQRIYELEVDHSVTDFLITDAALAATLGRERSRETPEKLLVRQDADCLEMSLYLEEELVKRLEDNDPYDALHSGNLADFCTALEGISHFLYVTWNATHDRSITLLELELQAEVDKYIAVAQLFDLQHGTAYGDALHDRLFRAVSFAPELDEAEKRRYWWANQYASRYCQHLHRYFIRPNRTAHLSNELRRFYRLSNQAKIRRITAPAAAL